MEIDIKITQAAPEELDAIRHIMKTERLRLVSDAVNKYGAHMAEAMLKNSTSDWSASAAGRVEDGAAYIAVTDGQYVGYADYTDIKGMPSMGQIRCSIADGGSVGAAAREKLCVAVVDKMRRDGKCYARVHSLLDDDHRSAYAKAGLDKELPEITYYAELAKVADFTPNPDVVIVPAAKEHIEDIKRIAVLGWIPIRKSQKALVGEDIYGVLFDNWEEKKCDSILKLAFSEDGCRKGYVALVDGKVAGFMTRIFSADEPKRVEIGNNAVSPDFAGRGIGSTLYRFVFDEAKKLGAKYIFVDTGLDEGHVPARRAYEKVGFCRAASVETADLYMKL